MNDFQLYTISTGTGERIPKYLVVRLMLTDNRIMRRNTKLLQRQELSVMVCIYATGKIIIAESSITKIVLRRYY